MTWLGLAVQSVVLAKPLNYPRHLSDLEILNCCPFVIAAKEITPILTFFVTTNTFIVTITITLILILAFIVTTITFITANNIIALTRLTLVLSCAMNFKNYPHDEQLCNLKIESSK